MPRQGFSGACRWTTPISFQVRAGRADGRQSGLRRRKKPAWPRDAASVAASCWKTLKEWYEAGRRSECNQESIGWRSPTVSVPGYHISLIKSTTRELVLPATSELSKPASCADLELSFLLSNKRAATLARR